MEAAKEEVVASDGQIGQDEYEVILASSPDDQAEEENADCLHSFQGMDCFRMCHPTLFLSEHPT